MGHQVSKKFSSGVGQLTLVEHALCPVDAQHSLLQGFKHETTFQFSTNDGRRRVGRVRVFCPLGISPDDELFLWGLLALTLGNQANDGELHATRHYLLRNLGLIDPGSRRGGRQYARFNQAIDRIAAAQYFNDNFYDPIRSEHVRVNFKFFSYIQPADLNSSRAWRIVWDPVFFQYVSAARGALRFDLDIYRRLNVTSRRLYLFASKLLARCEVTHAIDVRDLAVNVLGYSDSLSQSHLNAKVRGCLRRLIAAKVLREGDTRLYKRSKKRYSIVMAKGQVLKERNEYFRTESPLIEPLVEIGFEPRDARAVLSKFSTRIVREWIDITLAAKERHGPKFFKRSPAAYLRYNLNRAAQGTGTPPDWWHELRKAEEHRQASHQREQRSGQSRNQLPEKAMESLDEILDQFLSAGQSDQQAKRNAKRFQVAVANSKRKRN